MIYTKKQFLKDVAAEAKALKEHATKEELNNLYGKILEARSSKQCVYGLLTGDCFSARAADLIFKCCPRYFRQRPEDLQPIEAATRNAKGSFRKYVNGEKPKDVSTFHQLYDIRNTEDEVHFSSIEAYILQPWAQNANLIAFLRDERKDLVL